MINKKAVEAQLKVLKKIKLAKDIIESAKNLLEDFYGELMDTGFDCDLIDMRDCEQDDMDPQFPTVEGIISGLEEMLEQEE